MKKYIILAGSMLFASLAVQSCLDFDDPGDEMNFNTIQTETQVYVGNVDSIPYHKHPTKEGVKNAIETLNKYKYFNQSLTAQYNIRGGKEGGMPASHAYQRQYSLGPDLYAQYFTVPHKDFMYGSLTSTYNVSAEFNNGPLGAYTMAKNALMPLLNHPAIDSIPEMKAINLLYYCIAAQEMADLSGPFTYLEDKKNSEAPEEYNDLETIYYGIVENIDTIVACLKKFEFREDWYKAEIRTLIDKYTQTSSLKRDAKFDVDEVVKSYIKLANSLKLRMAMHIVQVEPAKAQLWAEQAVSDRIGVIEKKDEQHGIFPLISGCTHPLLEIANSWNDLRLSASFESLLMSLDHPYTKYLFLPNGYEIKNKKTGEIMPEGTRICGIRSGILVGDGQTIALNKRQAYSTFKNDVLQQGGAPLYFIKLAEVDFLRAEGALRGWNMGRDAKSSYERGVFNAYLEDPNVNSKYNEYVDDYLYEMEEPIGYVQVDPMGDGEDWPSVTTIGVSWNEQDSKLTKLEKIITQKYIALFPLSTEAWTELRRTGFPKLFPVLNADDGDGSIEQGGIIRRIPWVPTDPILANMVDASGIQALGGKPDEQATRLWWNVDETKIISE